MLRQEQENRCVEFMFEAQKMLTTGTLAFLAGFQASHDYLGFSIFTSFTSLIISEQKPAGLLVFCAGFVTGAYSESLVPQTEVPHRPTI